MANWNLEGQRVAGMYMKQFSFQGHVTHSRVKYGGAVQHTVVLDQPFTVYGAVRERILVEDCEILEHWQ